MATSVTSVRVWGWDSSSQSRLRPLPSLRLQSPTALTPGLPMVGERVEAGAYRYYTLRGGATTAAITISVTPISGDPGA